MSAPEPPARTGSEILRLAVRRNRGAMAAGTGLMGLYQAAETAVPVVLGAVVEYALVDGNPTSLVVSIAVLGLVILTVSMSWRFGMRILQKANTTEAHRWRVAVAACELQPVARDHGLRSGEVLTVATEDADQTADIIEVVPLLVSSLVAVAITAVVLSLTSFWLGGLVVLGTIAILVVLSGVSRRIGTSTQEQQARVARAGAKVSDLIAGLRPLHGFGGNHAAFLGYRTMSGEARQQAVAVARVNGAYAGVALLLNAALAGTVTIVAAVFTFRGEMSIGELVTAVGLAQFVVEPLKLGSEMPKYVMTARASAERMALVLSAPPVAEPGTRDVGGGGELELVGVAHGTLRDVGFRVGPGTFTAIATDDAGSAGDLAAVLAVATAGHAGEVRLAGSPVTELTVESVRAAMLVTPNHSEVFAGTVRSNIDPAGTSTLVDAAVEASMLSDVAELHAAGLDHEVRDRGANLSGGQRQRLTLARALAADPDILVLHDPTTAVDAVTEQMIAGRVAKMRAGRTTVVLTTSPPLLDVADRVLVVRDGTVAGSGSHAELLADDEDYRRLVAR